MRPHAAGRWDGETPLSPRSQSSIDRMGMTVRDNVHGWSAPGLATTIIAGLPQEQERGLGGWQAEAPVLADLFILAHGALLALVPVIDGLETDAARMAANLKAANIGSDTGESEVLVWAALKGRS